MRRTGVVALASVAVALAAAPAAAGGPQVAGLQVALRAHGVYPGPIDAIPGPLTKRGTRILQRRHGLAVDGIAGPRTRARLGRLGRPLFGHRPIRRGNVGWDVSVLQFALRRRGIGPGGVDGVFGPNTLRAVRVFQSRAGVLVDGIVGPVTRRALRHGAAPAGAAPRASRASPAKVERAIGRWAARYGVDPGLVRGLAWMESGNQQHVVSPVGARGVMQVTPATWRFVEQVLLGRHVRHTASGNVRVGVAYLRHLLREFGGSRRLAVGAYHQGAAAVRRYGLYRETRAFVRDVLALARRM